MTYIKTAIYKDYPNQPYISKERDLKHWEESPEDFPYGLVPKSNMILLPEGLFPGDVIMLWRISFGNFHNHSIIPQYFEYLYGVESDESIQRLLVNKYCFVDSLTASLDLYTSVKLKKVLKSKNLKVSGNKNELLAKVRANFNDEDLRESLHMRRYRITEKGESILEKYEDIIKKHGPKNS